MDFSQTCVARVEYKLNQILSIQQHNTYAEIYDWMRYCVLGGGKRIRAQLAYAACVACGGEFAQADNVACALELIHAYSLVHDDLPAMDNDILRRGKSSAHVAFGEANAILVGDALHTLAFEVLASSNMQDDKNKNANHKKCAPQIQLRLIQILASSVGVRGMIYGQMLDLANQNNQNNQLSNKANQLAELKVIHEHKTGALIEASVKLGALVGNCSDKNLLALSVYAKNLGLAFQVQDDVLDVISDTQKLGKTSGKDNAQNKVTYVDVLGLEQAKIYVNNLVVDAKNAILDWNEKANHLRNLADFVLNRNY